MKQTFPFEVPAGGAVTLRCELSVIAPGPFSAEVQFFVEKDGVSAATLSLSGEAGADPRE